MFRVHNLFSAFLLMVIGAASGGFLLGRLDIVQPGKERAEAADAVRVKTEVLQDSDWLSEAFWQRQREEKLRRRKERQFDANPWDDISRQPDPALQPRPRMSGTYRTVCVRLC
ncbi:MAG: hypothetical protein KKB37_03945, partial [Alphaproteobacteria bacterium]|nr:hypothetical protein [Alphaproteobacteria bacterium]